MAPHQAMSIVRYGGAVDVEDPLHERRLGVVGERRGRHHRSEHHVVALEQPSPGGPLVLAVRVGMGHVR